MDNVGDVVGRGGPSDKHIVCGDILSAGLDEVEKRGVLEMNQCNW